VKILVIQLRQMGDILLTTPVLQALKDQYPECDIDMMTYPMGKLIIPGNQLVREHLIAPQQGVLSALKFMKHLRSKSYDLVFDFMGTPRSAAIARLARSPRRISFETPRRLLFTDLVERLAVDDYIVREKFRLLEPLGIKASNERLLLPWTDRDTGLIRSFFEAESRIKQSFRRVVLSPTHRRPDRRWSQKKWAQLAVWLEQDQNAAVIWAWGPGEESEIDYMKTLAMGAGVKMPKASFRELAALVADTDLFIANSNGPSHIAVAVNTPSIQLHGPTSLVSWSPITKRHTGIQKKTMDDIMLEDVQDMVVSMWPLVDEGAKALREQGPIGNDKEVWVIRPEL
jgi:ADP-heptose:LPS heptosyltransferase